MNSTELRIGNLVEYCDEVVTVTGVTEENPFVNTITPDYLDYDEITPIPLTEEWLLKFGFVLNDSTKDFHFLEMRYWVKNSVMLFFNVRCEGTSFLTGHGSMRNGEYFVSTFNWGTKSVHQLQNLYFALTNEELKQ